MDFLPLRGDKSVRMETVKVKGTVSGGRALGRTLGYPTANIYGVERIDVADGVYAVSAHVEGIKEAMYGMANLGHRPTVEEDGSRKSLEVHFFDYEGDLYGRSVEVSLCKYIRPEVTFAGTAELREQLGRDERAVRDFFGL